MLGYLQYHQPQPQILYESVCGDLDEGVEVLGRLRRADEDERGDSMMMIK